MDSKINKLEIKKKKSKKVYIVWMKLKYNLASIKILKKQFMDNCTHN